MFFISLLKSQQTILDRDFFNKYEINYDFNNNY
jgi:hypothetical protein